MPGEHLFTLSIRHVVCMGVGSGGQSGGHDPPWIFRHGTDTVDRGIR